MKLISLKSLFLITSEQSFGLIEGFWYVFVFTNESDQKTRKWLWQRTSRWKRGKIDHPLDKWEHTSADSLRELTLKKR